MTRWHRVKAWVVSRPGLQLYIAAVVTLEVLVTLIKG